MIHSTSSAVRSTGVPVHRPLRGRNALRAAGLVAAAHAVLLVVAPDSAFATFGTPGDSAVWARVCGVLCASLAVVFWSASRWPSSMMQRPVLWSVMVAATGMTLIGAIALLDGTATTPAIPVVAVEAALAVWAGWLAITDRV